MVPCGSWLVQIRRSTYSVLVRGVTFCIILLEYRRVGLVRFPGLCIVSRYDRSMRPPYIVGSTFIHIHPVQVLCSVYLSGLFYFRPRIGTNHGQNTLLFLFFSFFLFFNSEKTSQSAEKYVRLPARTTE